METQAEYKVAPKEKEGKPRLSLLPWKTITKLSAVYEYGAKKYYEQSWRKGFVWGDIWEGTMRHLTKWWEGEDVDPESGLNHLLHAGFGVLTLIYLSDEFKHMDNRPGKEQIPF
jgi:hypothetical protein